MFLVASGADVIIDKEEVASGFKNVNGWTVSKIMDSKSEI